ncbi:DUF2796 domain-containing protein [Stutzerimonas nitrititolerans]|uniref:DUF2796 domain-containing protein n=1 Tax=Stutzerimonas nitrititolerans TaxID=2482751 RepID=UPI003AA89B6B
MRHLLLALPFALLPVIAHAAEHHHHDHHDEHASLGSHEHGVAQLDAALEGTVLEIELRSPAINLLGFEHAANSAEDKRKLADTRAQLEQPDRLFGLSAEAGCRLDEARLESPLFAGKGHEHEHEHEHEQHDAGTHSDVHAHYRYDCSAPDALTGLDLQALFEAFPGTEKIQAQVIAPNGQQGKLLRAKQAQITF